MLAAPMIGMPGGWELVLIVFVLILLFGAKKLPDLARGTGRALRIFKSETRGLMDDEDDDKGSGDRDNDRPREVTTGDSTESRSQAPSQTPSQAPSQAPSPAPAQGTEQPNPTHRPYES